ncbi:glycosyltransferase family 2 protein [Candidatus Ozemobacteraceae bacterium]|nr:glycosyltransferase family 2 protein [Candidatus Ozemobacteraceae bacterium]
MTTQSPSPSHLSRPNGSHHESSGCRRKRLPSPKSSPRTGSQGFQADLSPSDTLLCIPAFNEEKRLPETLDELLRLLPSGCDVLVVDDGSSDGTRDVASQAGVPCLALPVHLGYGGALQTGYKYALERGYAHLIQFDADGQHDPACLPDLLKPLRAGETDFVIGNRFHANSSYRSPFLRELGRRFFAGICRALSGFDLNDPTSGFKGFNRTTLRLLSRDGFPMDYPDADVFMMLHYAGIRIREVDILMRPPREEGSMHSGLFHPARYLAKMLLSIFMTILRHIGGSHG